VTESIRTSLTFLRCARKTRSFKSLPNQLKILIIMKKRNIRKKYFFTSTVTTKYGEKSFLNT